MCIRDRAYTSGQKVENTFHSSKLTIFPDVELIPRFRIARRLNFNDAANPVSASASVLNAINKREYMCCNIYCRPICMCNGVGYAVPARLHTNVLSHIICVYKLLRVLFKKLLIVCK